MAYPSKISADTILEAALAMIRESGWESLSMRSLATRLGVRASSLYHHFGDRRSLEASLGEKAAQALIDRLSGAATVSDVATSYLEFASQEPELYGLIARSWNQTLPQRLSEWTGNGERETGVAVWAYLHGYATLEAAGAFGPSGNRPAFEQGLRALLAGP